MHVSKTMNLLDSINLLAHDCIGVFAWRPCIGAIGTSGVLPDCVAYVKLRGGPLEKLVFIQHFSGEFSRLHGVFYWITAYSSSDVARAVLTCY